MLPSLGGWYERFCPDNRGGCHKNPSNSDLCGASRRICLKQYVCLDRSSETVACLDRSSYVTGWESSRVSCVQACMFV